MILLKKLKLSNFLSHQDTVIEFKKDDKLEISGKSGSGKSSIPEAITWCLYGEGRSDNKNLVKHGAKAGYVILDLQDDAKLYRIKRSTTDKAKNTLEVLIDNNGNWNPIDRVGIKDIQDWIESELLHCSYELFVNSVVYLQDNVNNFVKQTASKRKDLLLEIANIKNFDSYYSKAKDSINSVLLSISAIDSTVSANTFNLDISKSQIVDEEALEGLTAKHKEEIVIKRLEHDSLKSKRIAIKDSVDAIKKIEKDIENKNILLKTTALRVSEKMKQIEEIKNIKTDKLIEDVEKGKIARARRDVLSERTKLDYERTNKMNSYMADKPAFHDWDKDVSDLKRQIEPLVRDTKVCPAGDNCPFVIPIKNQIQYIEDQITAKLLQKGVMEKGLEAYQAKIASLGAPIVTDEERVEYMTLRSSESLVEASGRLLIEAETKQKMLPEKELELSVLLEQHDVILLDLNTLTNQLTEMKAKTDLSIIPQLDQLELTINETINTLEDKISKNNGLVSLSKISRASVKSMEERNKEQLIQKSKLMVQLEALNTVKDAFGSKGLKTTVIDYLIPRLEDKINEILARLSEFRVRLDTQKNSADGERTIEGLYINIINDRGEELEFSSYSGGEKLKISVSISEALATLQRVGFRVLDELFVGLDEEAIEGFADVMNKLNEKFNQTLCISHLRSIKDLFDNKITMTKINGTSIINK